MSFFSGRDGSLFVGGTRMGRVASWSLTANVDTLETTSLGDNERNYTPGLKAATGSASIFYHSDASTNTTLSVADLINKVIKTGAATDADVVTLSLRWDDRRIDVNAIINSADLSSQVGSVMQANISFTVTGDYQDIDLT